MAKAKTKTEKAPKKGKENAKAEGKGKGGKKDAAGDGSRRLGLRGAAPWAARHAAKHAAEARKRAAEPPLPGSARATLRTPTGAEDIKVRIASLNTATSQIKTLRKNLAKNFFDVGLVLRELQTKRLYEVKGISTFEAYLEREIDLGKTTGLRLVKIVGLFQKEPAVEYGFDRLVAAIMALEASDPAFAKTDPKMKIPAPAPSTSALPMRPPGR